MKILFEDNFNYTGKPDSTKWGYETGNGNDGFGNQESQYYTDSIKNAYVSNGSLKIVSLNEEIEGFHYTSARLNTYGKFSFTYGKVEILAKIPKGLGSWAALWMLPDSLRNGAIWPDSGEIDIMESVGHNQDVVHCSLHSKKYNHIINTQKTFFKPIENASDDFHLYAVDWQKEFIAFYYDDVEVARFARNGENFEGYPFTTPFHLILNTAVGGSWGGKIDKASLPYIFEIKSVRVTE